VVSLPTALTNIQVCVDCGGHLSLSEKTFHCQTCERDYLQNSAGVWDFRTQSAKHKLPDIFEEETFHEWLRVFQHQESKAWVIYKNSVYRFFAQAGHRILGQRIKKQINAGDLILEIGAGTGARFTPYLGTPLFPSRVLTGDAPSHAARRHHALWHPNGGRLGFSTRPKTHYWTSFAKDIWTGCGLCNGQRAY